MTKRSNKNVPVISYVAKKIKMGDKDGKVSTAEAVLLGLLLLVLTIGLTGVGYAQVVKVPFIGGMIGMGASEVNEVTSGFTGMSLAGDVEVPKPPTDTSGDSVETSGGLGGRIVIPPGATSNTLYVKAINEANTSATEYLAYSAYFYNQDDAPIGGALAVTASSAGTTKSLGIPATYRMRVAGSSTVNSRIVPKAGVSVSGIVFSADAGSPKARLVTDEKGEQYVEFETSGSNTYLTIYLTKRVTTLDVQAKTFSGTNLYNNTAATASDLWISVAANKRAYFRTTSANNTAVAVGSGGLFERQYWFQSNTQDAELNDFGVYYLVGTASSTEGTNTWNVPTVTLDDVQLTNIRGTMSEEELNKYGSTYYWAYLIDKSIPIRGTPYHRLGRTMLAKSGQNPTADIYSKFIVRGNYLALNGQDIKTAAVKDDTSLTAVYDMFEIYDDIS